MLCNNCGTNTDLEYCPNCGKPVVQRTTGNTASTDAYRYTPPPVAPVQTIPSPQPPPPAYQGPAAPPSVAQQAAPYYPPAPQAPAPPPAPLPSTYHVAYSTPSGYYYAPPYVAQVSTTPRIPRRKHPSVHGAWLNTVFGVFGIILLIFALVYPSTLSLGYYDSDIFGFNVFLFQLPVMFLLIAATTSYGSPRACRGCFISATVFTTLSGFSMFGLFVGSISSLHNQILNLVLICYALTLLLCIAGIVVSNIHVNKSEAAYWREVQEQTAQATGR